MVTTVIDLLVITVISGIAAYGLTMLLRYTSGPANVFFRLRTLAGLVYVPIYDEEDNIVDIIEEEPVHTLGIDSDTGHIVINKDVNFFASLFYCYWCLTTWVSFPIALLLCIIIGMWQFTPIVWLATIGISGYLHINGSNN